MKIYISSSWKNRDRVRDMAIKLRELGHTVYDFTDPKCRSTPEIPPEKYPEEFDPDKHVYQEYINKPEWKAAVMCNKEAIKAADLIILLLPCGIDSHADWALGVGLGKKSIVVGHPQKGERSPTHLWADLFLDKDEDIYSALPALQNELSDADIELIELRRRLGELGEENARLKKKNQNLFLDILLQATTSKTVEEVLDQAERFESELQRYTAIGTVEQFARLVSASNEHEGHGE